MASVLLVADLRDPAAWTGRFRAAHAQPIFSKAALVSGATGADPIGSRGQGNYMGGRRTLRRLRGMVSSGMGLNALARRRLDGSRAAILMYHRVLPHADAQRLAVETAMYVTPEAFDMQMASLRGAGFSPTSLHAIVSAMGDGRPLPQRAVAITFDDGWLDNHTHALPVLRRYEMPATVFVVTDRVGTPGAFWPDEAARLLSQLSDDDARELVNRLTETRGAHPPVTKLLEHLKRLQPAHRERTLEALRDATGSARRTQGDEVELMNWDQLGEMAQHRVDVESHGCTHELFDVLDDEALSRELEASRDQLEAEGHGRHRMLAYPSGAFDDRVREAARRAGYAAAVTTRHELATAHGDPLALSRLGVHQDIAASPAEFLQKVPGWH